jgi:hypothetical protein
MQTSERAIPKTQSAHSPSAIPTSKWHGSRGVVWHHQAAWLLVRLLTLLDLTGACLHECSPPSSAAARIGFVQSQLAIIHCIRIGSCDGDAVPSTQPCPVHRRLPQPPLACQSFAWIDKLADSTRERTARRGKPCGSHRAASGARKTSRGALRAAGRRAMSALHDIVATDEPDTPASMVSLWDIQLPPPPLTASQQGPNMRHSRLDRVEVTQGVACHCNACSSARAAGWRRGEAQLCY